MIPVVLRWDSRKKWVCIKWNRFFSLGWENGKVLKKIFGIPVPLSFRRRSEGIHLTKMRSAYLKEALSFLREWELKKVEGSISLPDPMINGLLYGLASTLESREGSRKIDITVNFLGENWCTGEARVSTRILFYRLKRWVLIYLKKRGETAKGR